MPYQHHLIKPEVAVRARQLSRIKRRAVIELGSSHSRGCSIPFGATLGICPEPFHAGSDLEVLPLRTTSGGLARPRRWSRDSAMSRRPADGSEHAEVSHGHPRRTCVGEPFELVVEPIEAHGDLSVRAGSRAMTALPRPAEAHRRVAHGVRRIQTGHCDSISLARCADRQRISGSRLPARRSVSVALSRGTDASSQSANVAGGRS